MLRTKYKKAKAFVKKHPTVTACAVTAVVTLKLSHNYHLDRYGKAMLGMGKDLETLAEGFRVRDLEMSKAEIFLDTKGLYQEFEDWADGVRLLTKVTP